MSIQVNKTTGLFNSLAVLLLNAPAVAALQVAAVSSREHLQDLSAEDCGYLASLAESAQIDLAEILSFAAYARQAFYCNRPLGEWLDNKQMETALTTIMHFAADMTVQLADLRDTAACEAAFRQAEPNGAGR